MEPYFRKRRFAKLKVAFPPRKVLSGGALALTLSLAACLEDRGVAPIPDDPGLRGYPEDSLTWDPPTPLEIAPASGLAPSQSPSENPLTVEGAALGEALFHDPLLSRDSTISCSSCHHPEDAFSDGGSKVSVGVRGQAGTRNAPALFNLGWTGLLFWDGRAASLEEQALHPVPDSREMDLPWSDAVKRLRSKASYRIAFGQAFGTTAIDSSLTARALAQYVRSLVSFDSRFDRWRRGELELTEEELLGYELFRGEKTDCHHCHQEPLMTRNSFHNIGLDSVIDGTGFGAVMGYSESMGAFKTPSLRNLAFTAPYMHDGRFATLDEVLDHYISGGIFSATLDRLIRNPATADERMEGSKTLNLTEVERKALLAFLNALNDTAFVARHAAR